MDPKQERDHKSSIVDVFQDNPRIIRDFSQLMDNQIDLLKDEYTEGVNNAELTENIALQLRAFGSQNNLNLEQQSFQSLSQDNSPEIDDNKLSPPVERRSRSVKNTVINNSFQKLQNMSFSWKSPSSSISHNLLNESQQLDNSPSKNIPNTVEFYHAYLAQIGENTPSEPQPVAPEDELPEASAPRESLGYSVPRSSIPQDIPEPEEIDIDYTTFEQATMKAMKNISLKLETSSNGSESRNSLVSERKYVNNNDKQDFEPKRISTLPNEREAAKEYNLLLNGQIKNKRSNSARQLTNASEVFLNISTLTAINDRKSLLRKSLQMRSMRLDSKQEIEEQRSNRFDKDVWELPQKEEKIQLASENKKNEDQVNNKAENVKSHTLENNKDFVNKYHIQNHYKNKGSYQKSQDSYSLEQGESEEKALKIAFPSMKTLTRMDISCQLQSSNNFSFSIDDGQALDRSELVREITKHQFLDRIQAESSPIPMAQNQGMWDCSILEDQPTLEESHAQLLSSVKKINARTFTMLRSAAQPSENIFVCCQAFVKLFAGLDNVIPSSFSTINDIQWVNIKALFSSPNKLIGLASDFMRYVEQRKIPQKNIDGVIAKLAKIQFDPEETPNDGFYQLYEFIVSAIEYNKLHRIHVKPQPRISTPVAQSVTQSQNQTPKTQPSPSKRTSATASPSKGSMKRVELNVSTNYNSSPVSASRYKSPSTASRKNSPSQTPKVVSVRQQSQEAKKPQETKKPKEVAKAPQEVKKKPVVTRSISNMRDDKRDKSMSNMKVNKTVLSTSNSPVRTRAGSTKMQSLNTSVQHYTGSILKGLDESTQIDQSQILEVEKMEKSYVSEVVVKKKESLNYRAMASRLLADHERYLKRKTKEEELKKEEVERKHDIDRRKRSVEHDKFQTNIERQFMKGLQAERFRIEKEIKRKEEAKLNESVRDRLDQSMINERFETSVILKRKQEKKIEIAEHHKSFTHDNKVKREKEEKEQVNQKKDELKKRVEATVYNKKTIAQEADKWKDNYLLLEKLIGNAK